MSQDNPTTPEDTTPEGGDWKAPASQAELDKIVQDRLARVHKQYADYDDVKAKAAEFDKAQEANKTEIEKANERASKAEAEAAQIRLEADRSAVALAKGLTPNQAKRLVGTTKEELEADADELVADLAKADKPKAPPKPPGGSGASGGKGDDDPKRALARQIFGDKT